MHIDPNENTEETGDEALDPIAEMQKGVAEANAAEAPMPEVNPEPKADDVKPDAPAPDAPADKPADASAEDAEAKKALDAEMDAFQLKKAARERFTSMAEEIAGFRPMKEALDAAGIKDISDIPRIAERASAADSFEQALIDTGAPPEDFAKAMDVLKKLNSGDMAQAAAGWDEMATIMRQWAPLLGKSFDGVDPFDGHDDIKLMYDTGQIPREAAIELAKARTIQKFNQERMESASQAERQQQEFTKQEAAANEGLNELGAKLFASDPQYKQKFPILQPLVASIKATLPPSEWVRATQTAYAQIKAIAPAPTATMAPSNPIRPPSMRPAVIPETDDPIEAMKMGIAAANGQL